MIGIGAALTTTTVILSTPTKVNADTYNFYFQKGISKSSAGDADGALAAYTMAIEINHKNPVAYAGRGFVKYFSGNFKGVCSDWSKALSLGSKVAHKWVKRDC